MFIGFHPGNHVVVIEKMTFFRHAISTSTAEYDVEDTRHEGPVGRVAEAPIASAEFRKIRACELK